MPPLPWRNVVGSAEEAKAEQCRRRLPVLLFRKPAKGSPEVGEARELCPGVHVLGLEEVRNVEILQDLIEDQGAAPTHTYTPPRPGPPAPPLLTDFSQVPNGVLGRQLQCRSVRMGSTRRYIHRNTQEHIYTQALRKWTEFENESPLQRQQQSVICTLWSRGGGVLVPNLQFFFL